MGFSNTSRTQYRYAVETTQNAIPAVAFQNITAKSGGLESNQTDVVSMGIRLDRTVQDQVLANRIPGGTLVFEAAYGVADPLIAGCLQDNTSWNQPTNFNTVAVTTASSVYQYTVAANSSTVPVGALLLAAGFTTAANDGITVCTSNSGGTTITFSSSASTPVTEASSLSKTVKVVGIQGSSVGEIQASASGLTSTITNFLSYPLVPYQVLKVGGANSSNSFGTAANNDYVRLTAISSYALTFDNLPTGWSVDTGSSAQIRVLISDYITNNTIRNSFTLEEDHPDIGFTRDFTGQYPDQLQIKMTPGQIIEGTFTMKGMGVTTGTSSATTGTPIAVNSNSVLNAVKNVVRINEAGVPAGKMSDGTLIIKNNLGDVPALNVLGNADVRNGQFNAEFDFSMYFSSTGMGTTLYTKHLNDTATALWLVLKDTSGNAYAIDMPSGKITTATTPVSGINQDYKGTYKFLTRYDSVSGKQLIISRLPVLAA